MNERHTPQDAAVRLHPEVRSDWHCGRSCAPTGLVRGEPLGGTCYAWPAATSRS